MKRKLLTFALAALTIVLLGSCKKEDSAIAVTRVTLDKTELTMTVGDSDVKLTATVAPENATDKTVSWSSDNTEVATVDQKGNVHAVAEGSATITVTTTDGGKTATCGVAVNAARPAGALSGKFTVNAEGKQVHFSQGNLVATIDASGAPTAWKFAKNQYDCLEEGGANKTIGVAAGDVDLFGWSTDATSNNWGINTTNTTDGSITGNFKDWGTAIDNNGTWRTLSKNEWMYLLTARTVNGGTGKDKSYSLNITYGGKVGAVLYPDNYAGSILSGTVENLPEGVVFLPAAGYRSGSIVKEVGLSACCWSSSNEHGTYCAEYVVFIKNEVLLDCYSDRYYGYNVRLVTESK